MRLRGPKSYPKELYIRDDVWRVRWGKKLLNDNMAYCDPSKKEIWIRLNQEPFITLRCFIHEVGHILEEEYCVEIPHKTIHKWEEAWADFIIVNGVACRKIFKIDT